MDQHRLAAGNAGITTALQDVDMINNALASISLKGCKLFDEAEGLTRRLVTSLGGILRLHHCPKELRFLAYTSLSRYLYQARSEHEWVTLAKWLLVFPLAKYLSSPPPAQPKTLRGLNLAKRFNTWFQHRLSTFSQKNTWFFMSWFQAKRACLPLSSKEVIFNLLDHRSAMGGKDTLSDDDLNAVMNNPNFTELLSLVNKKIHKSFSRNLSRVSRHACLEGGRSQGGQRTAIIKRCLMGIDDLGIDWTQAEELISTLDDPSLQAEDFEQSEESSQIPIDDPSLVLLTPDLWECYNIAIAVGYEIGYDLYSMDYSPREGIVINRCIPVLDNLHQTVNSPDLQSPSLASILPECAVGDEATCRVSTIKEPLKIRTVSAGPAKTYYKCKRLQVELHTILKKIPLFHLIGRPQGPTDISSVVPKDLTCIDDPVFLSADYKAATDNLSARLSASILHRILEGLPDDVIVAAKQSLKPHYVRYSPVPIAPEHVCVQMISRRGGEEIKLDKKGNPVLGLSFLTAEQNSLLQVKRNDERALAGDYECYDVTFRPVLQRNGQLMGSIMSFIILCLANAGIWARFLDESRPNTPPTFEEFINYVRINGDDLLGIIRRDHFDLYSNIAARYGLTLSIGKTYIHDTYCNINSTAYHYNLKNQVKYLSEVESIAGVDVRQVVFTAGIHRGTLHSPSIPIEVTTFNSGLYIENHKVMSRVGTEDDGPEIKGDFLPGQFLEIKDPRKWFHYNDIPKAAYNLMLRKKRKGIKFPSENHRPLFAIANKILDGVPPSFEVLGEKEESFKYLVAADLSKRIHDYGEDIFFYFLKRKWRIGRRNHFLPISAGGLGINPPEGYRFRINKCQRTLYSYLRSRTERFTTQLPLPGKVRGTLHDKVKHPFADSVSSEEPVNAVYDLTDHDHHAAPGPLLPYDIDYVKVTLPHEESIDFKCYLRTPWDDLPWDGDIF